MRKNLISSLILVVTLATFSLPSLAGTGETPETTDIMATEGTDAIAAPMPDAENGDVAPPPGE